MNDLSRATALRIGLAARALPETSPQRLLHVLVSALGLPLTEEKLGGLNVRILKTALDGELSEIEPVYLKQAVRYLKGEEGVRPDEPPLSQPLASTQGELPGSIRVAFASNSGERLDGHFGSCARFLIYQVTATASRLIAVRPVVEPDTTIKDEKHAYRTSLISDCHILYVISIGGPPAAKVIRAGVHPLKHPQEIEISGLLPQLQAALADRPPPWLARIIGTRAIAVEVEA